MSGDIPRWNEAARKGDPAGEMFLRVIATPDPDETVTFEFTTVTLLRIVLGRQTGEERMDLARIARSLSMEDYASDLIAQAAKARNDNSWWPA